MKNIYNFLNISPFDSSKICKFFPPDFFSQPPKEKKRSQTLENKAHSKSNINMNQEDNIEKRSSKSIIIDIRKDNEEVKELIDLIDGKRNYIFLLIIKM